MQIGNAVAAVTNYRVGDIRMSWCRFKQYVIRVFCNYCAIFIGEKYISSNKTQHKTKWEKQNAQKCMRYCKVKLVKNITWRIPPFGRSEKQGHTSSFLQVSIIEEIYKLILLCNFVSFIREALCDHSR